MDLNCQSISVVWVEFEILWCSWVMLGGMKTWQFRVIVWYRAGSCLTYRRWTFGCRLITSLVTYYLLSHVDTFHDFIALASFKHLKFIICLRSFRVFDFRWRPLSCFFKIDFVYYCWHSERRCSLWSWILYLIVIRWESWVIENICWYPR